MHILRSEAAQAETELLVRRQHMTGIPAFVWHRLRGVLGLLWHKVQRLYFSLCLTRGRPVNRFRSSTATTGERSGDQLVLHGVIPVQALMTCILLAGGDYTELGTDEATSNGSGSTCPINIQPPLSSAAVSITPGRHSASLQAANSGGTYTTRISNTFLSFDSGAASPDSYLSLEPESSSLGRT